MELTPEKIAPVIVGGLSAAAVFLVRWLWERFWKKKDDGAVQAAVAKSAAERARDSKVDSIDQNVAAIERRVTQVEAQHSSTARNLGTVESNMNRLEGKVEGLQKHWTGRFDKLEDEMKEGFKSINDKVEYKLDNLRMELRGDAQKTEEHLSKMLSEHRMAVHARLNEATAAQMSMINELMDKVVDLVGERAPAVTPPRPTTGD